MTGRYRLLATAGIVVVSFMSILFRLAEVAPATATFFRNLYALAVLVPLAGYLGGQSRSVRRRALGVGAGVMLGVDLLLWFYAIELVGAGLATVLANMQVVIVAFAAWGLYGERPHRRTFWVVPVILAGVVLISGLGRADAYGSDPVAGAVLGLLAAGAYAAFLLLFRAVSRGTSNAAAPVAEVTLGAGLAGLLGGLALGMEIDFAMAWPAHGWLLAMGLGGGVIGWLAIGTALPRLPALEVSVLLLLQPMLAMIWAALLLDEWVSALQWSGVALVLGGVAVLSIRGSAHAPPIAVKREAGRPIDRQDIERIR